MNQLENILDRPCQIHGNPNKPTTHSNRNCWVIKQVSRALAEEQAKGTRSEDEEDPRRPSNSGQKQFPLEVKNVNMIYVTHIPKKEHKRAL
jgi:hypothetical protein